MPAILLVFSLIVLVCFVIHDAADYRALRLLTVTEDRQRRYRAWTATSFVLFFLYPLLGLALLHRLSDSIHFPPQFEIAKLALRSHLPIGEHAADFLMGFGGAVVVGILVGIFLSSRLQHSRRPLMLESVEPLMPRNRAEITHTAALSLNAGLSEEVFFRLFLPLLFMELHFGWLTAFLLAALLFGLVHLYQGALGVVSTTILGLLFTAVYLISGNLWVAAGLHAALDLVQLVVRPGLRMLSARCHATPDDSPHVS